MRDTLLDKMKALAKSYAPEWSFTQDEPDGGSVVALLFKDMLEGSLERYDKVLHKHRIRYLNLFDRFKKEPVEPAKSFVRFTPVTGAPQPVHIPRGTRLLANSEEAGRQIVFETTHGITATTAELSAIYATDGSAGAIERIFLKEEDGGAENKEFTAFAVSGENLEDHTFLLGFEHAFEHLDRLDVTVDFMTPDGEAHEKIPDILLGDSMSLSILCEGGFEAFDAALREGDSLRLQKESFLPGKAVLSGKSCCQLAITAREPREMQLCGVQVRFSASDIPPDEVRAGGVAQNAADFRPFGLPMELYSSCEIESRTVFARVGARVELSFFLQFETLEQLLPEYEVAEEYKIIMKRPARAPRPVVQDVRADYALFEYLSDTGWKRLIHEEHAALIFNGSERGDIRLSFIMPADIIREELAPGQPRLRVRLLRADGLYRLPCVQHCPVIKGLRLSYEYAQAPIIPDVAVTRNNFESRDITSLINGGRNATLFYTREEKRPAIYMGFDPAPWGTPLSLYLRLENNADYEVDFTAECLMPEGFVSQRVADGTMGMLHSGVLCMVVPQNVAKRPLFGQELYWIRLICHNKELKSYNLPVIRGVYINMAKVENASTRTEIFYRDASDGQMQVNLEEQGILTAKVYVNEENAQEEENWVLWEQSRHWEQQGRVYDIDLAAGQIQIGKNALSAFPPKRDGPAVRVTYQSYHGSAANVKEGDISAPAASIRYISEVSNPLPAYGGYDGYNEDTGAAVIANMLRTRGRAVTRQDYFDIISQISYGVRQVKCLSGFGPGGEPRDDVMTIAVLIDEYEKGSHIFSGVKEAIRERLLDCSGLTLAGKTLVLTQPRFVRTSVRLWLDCERMDSAYDMQQECARSLHEFIDPLCGGFEGKGWEIGRLPTPARLIAYLGIRHPEAVVSKIVVTALYENREIEVDDQIGRRIDNPFAMAVNGEHTVYCRLM
ncbi:MAG: hypothetical protein LBU86_03965, partial [Oscillospiraceae bacterium]|nr:hypothetical protein [Oscillospiraceae bacterium]